MIKPTIGRVVLVTRDGVQSPALIAFVHGDTLINVGGFDAGGAPFSAQYVDLVQDAYTPYKPNLFAEWMPYQVGQAAKTEAAEQALQM